MTQEIPEFYHRLAAPIIEALANEKKGKVPLAMEVGRAFHAAKKEVLQDATPEIKASKYNNWSAVFPLLCKLAGISERSGYDYMALAEYADLSQSSASIAEALRRIADKKKAEGTNRKSPTPKASPKDEEPKDEEDNEDEDETDDEEPEQSEESKQETAYQLVQTYWADMTDEAQQQFLADVRKDEDEDEDVVPGLHEAIDNRDKVLIAKSIFEVLKVDLAKVEVQRVIYELRALVDSHVWPGEAPRPLGATQPEGSPTH
jgi:hypothetical protein